MSPLQQFRQWHTEELSLSNAEVPSAACLSTTGLDGYPNARFVDLKECNDDGFVITCPLHSRKALEIAASSKVALSFWWVNLQRQVRIQGDAFAIANVDADRYFAERSRVAQIISIVSKQGATMESLQTLQQEFQNMEKAFEGTALSRPGDWGGFLIRPVRIEFMQFRSNRFHERQLFTRQQNDWTKQVLQP